jgi:hypothetical protein
MTQTKKIRATLTGNSISEPSQWIGGEGVFEVCGNFGGGTVTLEHSLDGKSWSKMGDDTTLTASGGGVFAASNDAFLRINAANVSAVLVSIYQLA